MIVEDKQGFLSQGGTMSKLMRDKDWSETSLGEPNSWPQPLKTLVEIILVAKQPMFVAWGPTLLMLYNDPYIEIMATRHPGALGAPYLDVRSEIRSSIEPLVQQALAGEPVYMDDISLIMQRGGRPQETHFSFSYTPVRDVDGTVAGLFCTSVETTGQVISNRRRTLRLTLEVELRAVTGDRALPLRSLAALQAFLKVGAAGLLRVGSHGLVENLRSMADGGLATGRLSSSQMPRAAPLVSDGRGEYGASSFGPWPQGAGSDTAGTRRTAAGRLLRGGYGGAPLDARGGLADRLRGTPGLGRIGAGGDVRGTE
ncbi:MAG: PAS domain-containing protein [Janthinobacterium lividum]